jgi:uncharacterized protein YjbJ (UPF0337 family)
LKIKTENDFLQIEGNQDEMRGKIPD